jgi:hypothetical protein
MPQRTANQRLIIHVVFLRPDCLPAAFHPIRRGDAGILTLWLGTTITGHRYKDASYGRI